jgi:acyl-CoA dehydrogenase
MRRTLGSVLPDYATHEEAIGSDWYALDPNLRMLLDRLLPDAKDRTFAEEHVARYGALVGGAIAGRAEITDKHGPELRAYDRWGRDCDAIVHDPHWTDNKADLVRAGFVGLPWHAGRAVPAVVTAALAYLVCQAETALYCGLGMTAGAADIVERYAPDDIRDEFLRHLTSLDPSEAWEGGMFLTERQGGSDVGANTTRAVSDGEQWRLYGEKYFCSNVDAEVFVVLARPEGSPEGSRGLATFIVPRLLPDGSPNGFRIKRLKPKLGTVAVPTGEVELDGARAWLAGAAGADGRSDDTNGPGRGLNRMMEMVNASRFGVALMGLGIHRRCFLEGAIYAAHREQWGQRIDRFPLVRETLVDLLVDLEAGAAITFECAAAARNAESDEDGRRLRRILVPLAKIRTTREAIGAASQALELFGGNGYMEDWPMARQLRDAQCHTIWEGTENILCLDVLRAMRTDNAHESLFARIERGLDASSGTPALARTRDAIAGALDEAREAAAHLQSSDRDLQLLHARRFAWLLADVTEAGLLADEAGWAHERDGDARKVVIAGRFTRRKLAPPRARGILDDDRTAIDLFDPVTRYGRIEADVLA